ncbi:MAG: hypothetical protein JNK12_05920 [Acidimicrobiales bacterium]|nr:hypothetical protein [Acidimicrobiales bacterium]
MAKSLVERRLIEVGDALKALRADLRVADEQLAHLAEEAEESRLRSLVSETPLAEREYRESKRHADAMERHRREVSAEIVRLEQAQDELLDRLILEHD